MTIHIRSCLWLLGWIALIQLLTCLLGIGLINMVFDPLGGRENTSMLCLSIMLPWFLLGWITPKKARARRNLVLLTLALWTALTGEIHLLWGDSLMRDNRMNNTRAKTSLISSER